MADYPNNNGYGGGYPNGYPNGNSYGNAGNGYPGGSGYGTAGNGYPNGNVYGNDGGGYPNGNGYGDVGNGYPNPKRPKKSKAGLIILVIVIGLLVLGAIATGAYFILIGKLSKSSKKTILWKKITDYNADGTVDTWKEYEYDENGNNIKYKNAEYSSETEFNADGKEMKITFYFPDGSIDDIYEYEYDSDGQEKSHTRRLEDGTVYFTWDYDTHTGVGLDTYNFTEWLYGDDGKVIETTTYDKDAETDKLTITTDKYEYDADGNMKSLLTYDSDGNVIYEESYKDGKLMRKVYYTNDGSVSGLYGYEYDESGYRTKLDIQDLTEGFAGNWTYTYELDSEGNQVKEETYEDGELLFWREIEYRYSE